MRIISGEHDYYDSVQVYGHDPASVWQRTAHIAEIDLETLDFELAQGYDHSVDTLCNADAYVIGFCGRLYPCMSVNHHSSKNLYHYTPEPVVAWLEDKAKKHDKELQRDIRDVRWWFDAYKGVTSTLFARLQSPIWIKPLGRTFDGYVFVNYLLKEYNFQKVVDPVTAFQEIDMYLSGVLALQQPEMVEIADIDQRDKKGFDNWSFKTRPHE